MISTKCWRPVPPQIACLRAFVAFCDMPGGSVGILRGRRKALDACQCERAVFFWQAQHFVLVN